MPIKRVFIDVETSGLDEREHGIIQVSGKITEDDKNIAEFNFTPRLYTTDIFDKRSIESHGISEEVARSKERMSPSIIYHELKDTFNSIVGRYNRKDKMFFIAYNATFDDRFMRALWDKNEDKYYGSLFWWPPIDLASIAGHYLAKIRATLPNFKLKTSAKVLGISIDESRLHDSMYDIEITEEIYKKLNTRI